MKKILLIGSIFALTQNFAQTTIFQDNFNAGNGNWILNPGVNGDNIWVVNSEYAGIGGFIADTPNQPAAITAAPTSSYLHIVNDGICTLASICNANFSTSDASINFAEQSAAVSTVGFSGVAVSFYYLCEGAAGSAFGQLEYSTNNGALWTTHTANYQSTPTWTLETITLPAFNNVAQFKVRFKWQNGSTGNDPAFSVDEFKIVGTQSSNVSLTTSTVNPLTYCQGVAIPVSVGFTVSGTPNAGNVFTAQLSDATGSFTTPTVIGTLTSVATGALTISATIPSSAPIGAAYRIRVIGSAPATVGTDNGSNLSVNALPTASTSSNPANGIVCSGTSATLTASGGVSYVWSPTTGLNQPTGAIVLAQPTTTTIYTVIVTGQNGCTDSEVITVTVNNCASLEETSFGFQIYPNPAQNSLNISNENQLNITNAFISDNAGKRIQTMQLASATDVSALAAGTYFITIEHESGRTISTFVKN